MDQFMYALTAPYITWPGYEDIYQSNDNRTKALVHRLGTLKEIFATQHCSEFEAMLYLSTATLKAPPSHDWFQIYMWLFNRIYPEAAQQNDLKPDQAELNVNQQDDLARLRSWIFRQQMAHLKAKRKAMENGTPAQAPEVVEDPVLPRKARVEQPKMF